MGYSTKVACGCGGRLKVEKVGVVWHESHRLWAGDLLECQKCYTQVISLANAPYAGGPGIEKSVELAREHGVLYEAGD